MLNGMRTTRRAGKHDQVHVGGWFRRIGMTAGVAVAVSLTAACDSLLEVELPGFVQEESLNNPALAVTLVRSAQTDFECMLAGAYIDEIGLWAGDWYFEATGVRHIWPELRIRQVEDFEQMPCDFSGPTRSGSTWLPLSTAVSQGNRAIRLVGGFADADVAHKPLLLAKAHAYTGYALQIMGETMCEITIEGGPLISREATMTLAEQNFTTALQLAGQATSAPAGETVRSIVNLARVGRARSRLHLGDAQGVISDASQVDAGYVRVAQREDALRKRINVVFLRNNRMRDISVHPSYRNLTVDGVPDPRVPTVNLGPGLTVVGQDYWQQQKYTSGGADVPFATWREAQLMIAEVSGGQTAVDIINTLRATHGLPAFSSSDPEEIMATVLEERRRELWLQGTKLGDILRVQARADLPNIPGYTFDTGLNQRGQPYEPETCYPLPTLAEKNANPNI